MFISCDSCAEETVLFILQKFTRFEFCGLHHHDNNRRIIVSLGNSFISLTFTTGGCEAQRESGEAARTSTVIQDHKRADGHTRKVPGSGTQCQVPSTGLSNQPRLYLGSHRAGLVSNNMLSSCSLLSLPWQVQLHLRMKSQSGEGPAPH